MNVPIERAKSMKYFFETSTIHLFVILAKRNLKKGFQIQENMLASHWKNDLEIIIEEEEEEMGKRW